MPNPIANAPTDFEVCDDNNDGIAVFALGTKTPEVEGGQTGMLVSYHATPGDALSGTSALPDPYSNTVAGGEEVYVRIEDSVTGCFATTTLQLVVHPVPSTVTTDDIVVCDVNNPGDLTEVFDLSAKNAELIDGQANVAVAYYPSQADADALTNAITAPYANINTPQTIVAVLTNTLTGCSSQIAFALVVEALPTAVFPTPLEVCDDGTPDGITSIDLGLKDTEVSGGNGTYLVSYHETQGDADLGQNDLPIPYTNLANNQVVIVRVEDASTGCYATVPLELVVEQAPVAFVPQPLVFCDPDSDGFGEFDLTLADAEITGGDATLEVSYHETQANADNGVDAIDATVPYNNIVQDGQTLFARVESPTIATDCATVVELQLIVEPTPQLGTATALEECDDASADGLAEFDLTAAAADILDGLDATQYILSYYESEAAADAGTPAIAVPTAYTNTTAGMQTVWVRVDDTATLGGCYKLAELELMVNPLPVLATPPPLSLCDALTPGDGQEPFDLTEADATVLNGQTGILLTYHETLADADAGTGAITGPYLNTMNAQTVYVRGEDELTGCYATVTLTLRVDPVPSPEPNPDPIEVCDDDNDGFAEFDLEVRTVEITNGEADVVITYHETQEEAEQGDNPIIGLYTNIVADSQEIYVRSENTITGCYSLTLNTLELIVVPSPEVPQDLPPLVRCDDDGDGITQFDLTEMDALVYGTQDPAQLELSYHIDAADAATGANPIANVGNYTNTSNPQTLYVRLYDPVTDCLDTGGFELQVELPPVAVQPSPLELCDDLGEPGDQLTVFDLTVKDTEITGGNASWSVSYYETDADAQGQTGAIPDPSQYTNTSVGGLPANPQTLYVVVTDNDTGCVDFATLTIRVLPNPTPTPSDLLPDLELCDEVNTGDGVEAFDLTENELLILNGEAGVTPSYHTSAEDADSGANAIADPTVHINTASPVEDIHVRVENDVTGCYTVVEFSIIVNPLPTVVAVTDLIQCELNTDGSAQFDLTEKDTEVLGGQDPSAYTVSYHETLADAEALDNGITGLYTNTANPQEIYVAITDNATGCSVATQRFGIEVQEAAVANPGMEPLVYPLCDDAMETDGDPTDDSVQFELSTQDGAVLDGQDPADYTVSYYATEQDALLLVNPLPDLYENVANPQVIYARVDNDTPDASGQDGSICFDVAPMTLRVDPLPEFDLEDSYLLCVGTDGSEVVDTPVLDTGLSATDHTFEWSLDGQVLAGETGPSLVPLQGGSYMVVVEDVVTGCLSDDTALVEESGPPDLDAELVSEAFTGSNVIQALATGQGVYEYSLDGGPWQEEGVFLDVRPGIRTVSARDVNGCGVASVEVQVIDYPRFFTPNGDGNNDTWNIVGLAGQPNAKIYIFDRYGKLIKQLSPGGSGWDGTFNGNRMPTSDYWFTLAYDEPLTGQRKELNAHFTLKR
ncbi:T9SS type B sorting domain-containing protein [Winogradskyella pelagia]|uniref:T9SS type B sorting domain-containing protein n=1 Tax=Winogradskyella pelagia TaxID=2819984 RepID=UPI001FBA1F7A|nr:T9SS type B sorting domain-containing protein [Winogradskyella sp. DF17]